MPDLTDPMLDKGEAVVREGIRVEAEPRDIAKETYLAMDATRGSRGRPKVEFEGEAMADLRGGMTIREVVKKYNLSGSVRQRLWKQFKEG